MNEAREAALQGGALPSRLLAWAVGTEASSRSSALIRIGLVVVIWARFSEELVLFKHLSGGGLAFSASYFLWSAMMLFGLFSRTSTLATAAHLLVIYFYGGHVLGNEPWTHHHVYLLSWATLLCALTPCGRSYSLDRWFVVRRAERYGKPPPPERGNLWGLRLIAIQLCLLYLWTAYDKSSYAFLSGQRLESIFMYFYFGSVYPTWAGFKELMIALSWIVVAGEYALGLGLLFARTRRWLILPGLALHAAFYVLLPVSTYSMTVWVLYLALIDADTLHGVIDRMSGYTGRSTARD